jgi:hypothetical protein
MFRYLLITATILAISSAAAGAADYPVYSLVRINTVSDSDLRIVESLPFDVASVGDDYVDAVVPRDRISMLDDAGLDYRIEIEDMTGFYQARLASEKLVGVGSMGGYRTLSLHCR